MITQEELSEIKTSWDSIASGYNDYVTPTHFTLANEALRLADIKPGIRFLDVAAGTGALSIPAAQLGAEVLSIDFSPKMIDNLKRQITDNGLVNVEARVMDGHHLELEDNLFDITGSQFGVMLFSDLPRGIKEMTRVTRPEGKVLLIVYGHPSEVEFLSFFTAAMRKVNPEFTGLPSDPPPLPFQVADPAKMKNEMINAGLKDVHVETTIEKLEFESGEQLWNWLLNSNPIPGMLVKNLNTDQMNMVKYELDQMITHKASGKKFAVLTNPVNIGIGLK